MFFEASEGRWPAAAYSLAGISRRMGIYVIFLEFKYPVISSISMKEPNIVSSIVENSI